MIIPRLCHREPVHRHFRSRGSVAKLRHFVKIPIMHDYGCPQD